MKAILIIIIIIAILYCIITHSIATRIATFCIALLPLLAIGSLILPFLSYLLKADVIVILIAIGCGIFIALFNGE